MTSPLETLLEHAGKAQAAVQAQRESAARVAAEAVANRAAAQQGQANGTLDTTQGQAQGG